MISNEMQIRALEAADCSVISEAFRAQGWDKPEEQYRKYLRLQNEGVRDILVAEVKSSFAGYLTIRWQSGYDPFRELGIPEIVDFNVLRKFQRKGVGTALMDEAEQIIAKVSPLAGIGFGVTQDYGAAQILYIKRGYIPDGRGLTMDSRTLPYGEVVRINDDLVFHLIKPLR